MKVAVVEDQLILRDVLCKICSESDKHTVVAAPATGTEAVEAIRLTKPDLILLDLGLPDFDGLEVLNRVRDQTYDPRVLVLSGYGSPYMIFRIAKARVHGFIDKQTELVDSVRAALAAVRSDRTYFSASFTKAQTERQKDPFSFDKLLSEREILILSMISHQFVNEEIARDLEISIRTVEGHRHSIMRKLGVESRIDLMRYARTNGFTLTASQRQLATSAQSGVA